MKTIVLIIVLVSSAFSQGTYLSDENGLSAGLIYGKYSSESKFGYTASFSLKGFLDLSYTRTSISSKEKSSNFQNEYFLRAYAFKKNKIFASIALGYLYGEAKTELWKDFTLKVVSDGFAFEGGIHYSNTIQKNKRMVISFIYRYFEPTIKMQAPSVNTTSSDLNRAYRIDAALIYYFSQLGVAIGPSFVMEYDIGNAFFGLNLQIIFRH